MSQISEDAVGPEKSDLDAQLRRFDPDRWLSSRFIGSIEARADVVAIYAFDHELARAPKVASNALLGEMRLTWWREALAEMFEGRPVRRHPPAQALAGAVERRGLKREPLETMMDARYRDLDSAPMEEAEVLTGLATQVAWARNSPPRCWTRRQKQRWRWRAALRGRLANASTMLPSYAPPS